MSTIIFSINFSNFDGTASPPAHDDSFFYIRYPIADKLKNEKQSNQLKSLTEAISDLDRNTTMQIGAQKSVADKSMIKTDFTKHTEPCKMFLDNTKNGKYITFFIFILN